MYFRAKKKHSKEVSLYEPIGTDKEGNEKTYEVNLADICFILSIPLRDMYLKEHPEIMADM